MWKEIIICIVIVILIFIGNYASQNYTVESVKDLNTQLSDLEELIGQDENNTKIENKIEEIKTNWDDRYKKLAYFIEHDELEKVEANLTSINGLINAETLEDVRSEIQETEFILKHIEKKYAFIIENIF